MRIYEKEEKGNVKSDFFSSFAFERGSAPLSPLSIFNTLTCSVVGEKKEKHEELVNTASGRRVENVLM